LSLGATPAGSTESATSGALAAGAVAIKVYSAGNATDAPNWNSYGATPAGTTGVASAYVWFGPGATNGTAYVYGAYAPTAPTPAVTGATVAMTKLIKRTLNASIVANGTDTTEAANSGDAVITITSPAAALTGAVGPGYLAILSHGNDGTNGDNVYLNLVSGTSATATMVTAKSTTDGSACAANSNTPYTATTYGLGNIFYDIGSSAFYYTYWKNVVSTPCTSGTAGTPVTTTNTVYLGGVYTNGSAVYTNPGLAFTTANPASAITNLVAGNDNWLAASNIWLAYKDATKQVNSAHVARNATTGGTFAKLIADDQTSNAAKTYYPIGVWASNNTYGIAVAVQNQTAAAAYNYPILNFLNGSSTGTDSGLSYTGVTSSSGGAIQLWGWPLTSGYTLAASWMTSTANTPTYVYGTFYANGTVNMTQATIGGFQGQVSFYEDVNGSFWLGYEDIDTANTGLTYAGYLAKLQNQINSASSSGAKLFAFTWAVVALIFISLI
jgi:hypothetical protein